MNEWQWREVFISSKTFENTVKSLKCKNTFDSPALEEYPDNESM